VVARQVGLSKLCAVCARVQHEERRRARDAALEPVEAEAPQLRSMVPRRHAVPVAVGRSLVQLPRAGYRSLVISVTEALQTILDATPVLGVERVALLDALGRVAAEE
jgi:hypothetical protein